MALSQITLTTDSETLRKFRAACLLKDTTPTKELASFIAERLAQWGEVILVKKEDTPHVA